MAAVAIVHRARAARMVLRRGMARRGTRVVTCGSLESVIRLLQREVVDAVVADPRSAPLEAIVRLINLYPHIPVFASSSFHPDDGSILIQCRRAGVRGFVLDDVDGAGGGEWIAARSAGRRWKTALRDAPALLRLTEPLQLRVWEEVLLRVGTRSCTSDFALDLGISREHLSREFAAGGAPNLKRVIDLSRVSRAADLLANPGYDVATVSRVLRYATASHLAQASRRIAGVTPSELPKLGARQVFFRFLRGRTRSRV